MPAHIDLPDYSITYLIRLLLILTILGFCDNLNPNYSSMPLWALFHLNHHKESVVL